jgi:hypothetical protein
MLVDSCRRKLPATGRLLDDVKAEFIFVPLRSIAQFTRNGGETK